MPEKYSLKFKGDDEGTIVIEDDGTIMICPSGQIDAEICITAKGEKAKETALEYFRLFGFSIQPG